MISILQVMGLTLVYQLVINAMKLLADSSILSLLRCSVPSAREADSLDQNCCKLKKSSRSGVGSMGSGMIVSWNLDLGGKLASTLAYRC